MNALAQVLPDSSTVTPESLINFSYDVVFYPFNPNRATIFDERRYLKIAKDMVRCFEEDRLQRIILLSRNDSETMRVSAWQNSLAVVDTDDFDRVYTEACSEAHVKPVPDQPLNCSRSLHLHRLGKAFTCLMRGHVSPPEDQDFSCNALEAIYHLTPNSAVLGVFYAEYPEHNACKVEILEIYPIDDVTTVQ